MSKRNLLLCCDGTGNQYGCNNTNVVKLFELAEKSERQGGFYDPGVGTGGADYVKYIGLKAWHDKATGQGVQKNVEDAYRYLMQYYREQEERLYLFGFSRGAFTARSLAGMLHKVGLLRPGLDNMVEYAGKIYSAPGNEQVASGFKEAFSRPCPVYFVGVWDTVESLVMSAGRKFHDCRLHPEIPFGFHALAVDEVRKDFPPSLWDESCRAPGQTLEQVWFPGVHSDVGGWYPECGLSNAALRWMARHAMECGLHLDRDGVEALPCDPHDQLHVSYQGGWRMRGRHMRTIPEGAKLHRSVLERRDKVENGYAPNLPGKYKTVD